MIVAASIGLNSGDRLEDSLHINITANRVTIHIGPNMVAMYWSQFEILMQQFVLAWDKENQKRIKKQNDIQVISDINVGVGDAIKLDDSVGGKG